MKPIAYIENDYSEKFGIPRQAGLVHATVSCIRFVPEYRDPEAFRGLDGFSHIWLIWEFSEARRDTWSPTVRPPRLGGNTRLGVFATRSPYRPNPIGLSCVRLLRLEHTEEGPVLVVSGADLMDGTPILDVKPYLPYADAVPDARGGFTDEQEKKRLAVIFPQALSEGLEEEKKKALTGVLAQDPRPSYQSDENRVYGVSFAGYNIKFTVKGDKLTVCAVEKR